MKHNAEDVSSFLSFRHPLSTLKDFKYPYTMEYDTEHPTFEVAKREIEINLINEISNQLKQCDQPAVMMSAGVDSVLLASMIKKASVEKKKIHLYTAKMLPDTEYLQAEQIAKHLGLKHKSVEITPEDYLDIDKYLKPLIKQKGEPLHSNEISLAKMEIVAKQDGCDLAFCGEGADGVFGGYDKLLTFFNTQHTNFWDEFLNFYRYFSLQQRKKIINPKYLTKDTIPPMKLPSDWCNWVFHFIQKYHTPGLIKRAQNAFKYANIKGAFPYINKELVSYVNSLPFGYKLLDSVSKYILREVATKYIPKEWAYTPKKAFKEPFKYYMKNINTWDLSPELFVSKDISSFDGWHKWMLINLNTWWECD